MTSSGTAEILKYPPPGESDDDQETASMEDLNGPALDLKLCNDRDGGKQQSSPAASQSSNEAEAAAEGGKNYCCKYCNKRFSNSQALGGHQNAHKRERAVAKKEKGFQEAARAAIESRLYPFSTISAYNSRYGIGAASFSSPGLGIQRQSFIHKPFTSGGYRAGTSNTGSGRWSGYSDYDARPFPAFANQPAPNHKYGIQIKSPNMMSSYWGRDGASGGGYQPLPPQARPLINVGAYQPPAPPSRAFNVCGPTANRHSFGWSTPGSDASRPADHRPSGGGLLQLQRVLQEAAEVGRVPAVEKQTSRQAVDLTLKL